MEREKTTGFSVKQKPLGAVSGIRRPESVLGNQVLLQRYGWPDTGGIIQRFRTSDSLIRMYDMKIEHNDFYVSNVIHVKNQSDIADLEQGDSEKRQVYFYRSMTAQEADSWLNGDGEIKMDSGQPWASNFKYSKEYMGNNSLYPIMLEAYVPGFVRKARAYGIRDGKHEGGNVSWGVGFRSENSFEGIPTEERENFQKEVKQTVEYSDPRKPNEMEHVRVIREKLKKKLHGADLRQYNNMSEAEKLAELVRIAQAKTLEFRQKLVLPTIFKKRISQIRVVCLNKRQYDKAIGR